MFAFYGLGYDQQLCLVASEKTIRKRIRKRVGSKYSFLTDYVIDDDECTVEWRNYLAKRNCSLTSSAQIFCGWDTGKVQIQRESFFFYLELYTYILSVLIMNSKPANVHESSFEWTVVCIRTIIIITSENDFFSQKNPQRNVLYFIWFLVQVLINAFWCNDTKLPRANSFLRLYK